jgi:2-oxo-4-hydroxy-4-carboxy-5-ureidoimidazoline decarboxylase
MTIEQLNAADRADFVTAVGFAFEDSPWIAEEAWSMRPFSSVDALHGAMIAVVERASPERRLALVRAHPDLAGRLARQGRLSVSSAREQQRAGLSRLLPHEIAAFDAGNAAYRERFGFPFVICVRDRTSGAILSELDRRLTHDPETELATALDEIGRIARFRLLDRLGS